MKKSIKDIFTLLSNEPGKLKKMEILEHYKENPVLKKVLYLAHSGRVKFYIKQIPSYTPKSGQRDYADMPWALDQLEAIRTRKLTGADATNHLAKILSNVTQDDAYVVERIIEKDCKIGMDTAINKVIPGLIEETPYMGARPYDIRLVKALFLNGKTAYSQVKMDGRYCNASIVSGVVSLEARSGEPNPLEGAAFIEELKLMPDCILNGELTMNGFTRYESNGIIASLIDINKKMIAYPASSLGLMHKIVEDELRDFQKDKNMTYEHAMGLINFTVWDVISHDEYAAGESIIPYHTRLDTVRTLVGKCSNVKMVYSREVSSVEEAMEHFQECLENGEEGTILKAKDGKWKDGKPTWQVKFKLELHIDLKITKFNYGTKGSKNEHVIASLTAESADGLLVTRPTGINEKTMAKLAKDQAKLLGSIVEVKCSGVSKNSKGMYALLHPVYKKIRDDKTVADDLPTIMKIDAAAKGLS